MFNRDDNLLQIAEGAPKALIYPQPKPLAYLSDREWECLMHIPQEDILNFIYLKRSPKAKQALYPIDRAPKYPIPERPTDQSWGRFPLSVTDPILALPSARKVPDIPKGARYPFAVMDVGDSFVAPKKVSGAMHNARRRLYPKDWVSISINDNWMRVWRTV